MTSVLYSLPLTNMLLEVARLTNVLYCVALKMLKSERKAEKLHRQFAHASKEKLISLFRGSKAFNDKKFLDLIHDICDSCSICLRFPHP